MVNTFIKQFIKSFLKFIGWSLFFLIIALLVFYFSAPYIIKQYAQEQGIEIGSLSIGPTKIKAKNISFQKGSLKDLRITYTIESLLNYRFNSIVIRGGDLNFDLQSKTEIDLWQILKSNITIDKLVIDHLDGTIKGIEFDDYEIDPVSFTIQTNGFYKDKGLHGNLLLTFHPLPNFKEGQLKAVFEGKQATVNLSIKDLYDPVTKMTFSGIDASTTVPNLLSFTTASAKVHISSFNTPLGIVNDAKLDLNLSEDVIKASNFTASFLDGLVQVDSFQLYPFPHQQFFKFQMNNLSLEKLIQNLNEEGLSVTGKMSGVLPIHLYNDLSFSIDKTTLETVGPGRLSYTWTTAESSDNSNLQMTAQALKDFNYQSIQMTLSKPLHKNMSTILFLKGNNPHVLKNRELNIKIDLSGDILQTIVASWQAFLGKPDLWGKVTQRQ